MATPLEEQKYPLTKLPTTSPVEAPNTYADLFALFNAFRKLVADIVNSLTDYLKDAPSDGVIYGRQDAEWIEIPAAGTVDWGDIGGTLSAQTDLATALSGKEPTITAGTTGQYWRGDKTWQTLPAPGISDAPSDGNQYARQDGAWEVVTGGSGGDVTHEILACDVFPSASGGASAFAVAATGSNLPDLQTISFDPTTEQYAQFSVTLPPALLVPGDLKYYIRWSHPAATAYNIVWGLQAVSIGDGDSIATAFGTAEEVLDSGGATNDLYITDMSDPITIGGTGADTDPVFFRVYRKAASGLDTLDVAGRLHSILLTNAPSPPPPGSFTTWNPADKGSAVTLTGSDLQWDAPSYFNSCVRSVFSASSGKWFWEVTLTTNGKRVMPGVAYVGASLTSYPGSDSGSWGYYGFTGQIYHAGSTYSYGTIPPDTGGVIGLALDMDAGTLEYYFNGVAKGIGITGLTGAVYAFIGNGDNNPSGALTNFGATPFTYSVPLGFNPGFG